MKWEWTREEEFIGATTRHQMTTKVKIGAKKDGTLTALDVHVVSNTGAYGNHASETLAAAHGEPDRRLSLRQQEGRSATSSTPTWSRAAASAATAPRRPPSPSNAPSTSWPSCSASIPFEIRRKNVVRPGDNVESIWKEPSDASFGSYGIDQCLDIVERELKNGNGVDKPDGDDWLEGTGAALAMLECGPPTEHRSGAEMKLLPDGTYHLACRLVRDGQRHHHGAQADRRRGPRRARRTASTSSMPTPTARPTTPAPSPAPARWWPARRCEQTAAGDARRHPRLRRRHTGAERTTAGSTTTR